MHVPYHGQLSCICLLDMEWPKELPQCWAMSFNTLATPETVRRFKACGENLWASMVCYPPVHMKCLNIQLKSFTDIYPAKHVTPYMHCMTMHMCEFMHIHGALLPFTQQGLEKYNDQMTKNYFRSSSHCGQERFIQIMQKQNRIEHLEHSGAQRSKRYSAIVIVVYKDTTD